MRLKVDNFNYFVNYCIAFGLYAKKLSFIPPSCLLFSFLTLSSHFMCYNLQVKIRLGKLPENPAFLLVAIKWKPVSKYDGDLTVITSVS